MARFHELRSDTKFDDDQFVTSMESSNLTNWDRSEFDKFEVGPKKSIGWVQIGMDGSEVTIQFWKVRIDQIRQFHGIHQKVEKVEKRSKKRVSRNR